jgi:hypothetical protein
MLSTGIKQILAQNILAAGNPAGTAATAQANGALNQIEALSKTGINSPQATINATTAIVNGNVQGAAAGYAPSNSAIDNAKVTPSFTPVPSAPTLPPIQSVKTLAPNASVQSLDPKQLSSLSPSQIQAAATEVSKTALPSFAKSPAFASAVNSLPKSTAISPDLGKVTEQFESGRKGVFAYSNTRGDPGGPSYGAHQLSAGGGSLYGYLKSPEGAPYTQSLQGLRPGTPAFNQQYQAIARADPQGFAASQNAFYARENYYPKRDFAINKGFDLNDRGVQEAIFSGAVQHGGMNKITAAAARRLGDVKNASAEDQINALYDARTDYVANGPGGRALGARVKQGVLDRYTTERQDVLKYAGQPAVADGSRPAGDQSAQVAQATESMKQYNDTLKQTGTTATAAVQPMKSFDTTTGSIGQASQTAQTGMQGLDRASVQTGTAAATAAPSYTQLGASTQQAASSAQQAGSSFQQAGTQIQSAGASAQTAGSSAGSATGGFGGLGGSLTGLLGPIASAKGGLGSLGSSLLGFIQQLLSSSGGLGGGGGGLFGGLGGLFGGLFAEGGEISGPGTGTSDSIMAQVSNGEFIVNAKSAQKNLPLLHAINNDKMPGNMPKFAKGGVVGSGLGLGERAMARSSLQPSAQVAALSNQVAALTKVVSNGGSNGQRISNVSQNITVNANDAGSFRRSEGQITSDAFLKMNRAARRNG